MIPWKISIPTKYITYLFNPINNALQNCFTTLKRELFELLHRDNLHFTFSPSVDKQTMTDKRKDPPTAPNGSAVIKRQRQTADGATRNGPSSTALTIGGGPAQQQRAIIQSVKRTSALRAPIMELSGHAGEIFACRFDSSGHHIASGSFDRTICTFPTWV